MAEKGKVVDAEFVPVNETVEQPRTELVIGVNGEGSVYYRITGPDQSLITIEGLLKYVRVEMDRLWSRTMEKIDDINKTGA
jgi:hypothetical protein